MSERVKRIGGETVSTFVLTRGRIETRVEPDGRDERGEWRAGRVRFVFVDDDPSWEERSVGEVEVFPSTVAAMVAVQRVEVES